MVVKKQENLQKQPVEESANRWAGYVKAASLGAFALGVAGTADANIVSNNSKHNGAPLTPGLMIFPPTLAYQNAFDIDNDGTVDFYLGSGGYGSAFGYDNTTGGTVFTSADPNNYAEAFAQGAIIDGTASPAGNFFSVEVLDNTPGTAFGAGPNIGDTTNGNMGFVTSLGYFGWMDLQVENVGDQSFNAIDDLKITILDWAYENTGAGIPAGVPEPNSLMLLAAGSVGLLARRRRKKVS